MFKKIVASHNTFILWAGRIARLCWGITIALLVLAAIYISLARQFVPLLAPGYKTDVENQLSLALQASVHIKEMSGEVVGFNPQIILTELQVGNQTTIKRVSVELDVVKSMLARQLRLADVKTNGIEAILTQVENGWQLGDVFFPHSAHQDFSWAAMLSNIHVSESNFNITFKNKKNISIEKIALKLNQLGKHQRIKTDIAMPNGRIATVIAEGKGAWSDLDRMEWDVYTKIPDVDWLPWIQSVAGDYVTINKMEGGAQIWLQWRDGKIDDVRLRVELPILDWQYLSNQLNDSVQGVHADVVFQQKNDKTIISVPLLSFIWHGRAEQLGGWSFSKTALDSRSVLLIKADELKIDSFVEMALGSQLLPPDVIEALSGLNPRGNLNNVKATAFLNNHTELIDFKVSGDVKNIALNAWDGSPKVSGVNGVVEFSKLGGHLALDSTQFTMEFPDLFSQGWTFQRAKGDLYWVYDDTHFIIRSGLLNLQNDNASVFGQFDYTTPHDVTQADHLGLQLGFKNIDAQSRMQYIPTKEIDKSLADWLQQSIVKGTIVEGSYLYDGAVESDSSVSAAQIVALDVKDVTLKFDPNWPALENVNGSIIYNNDGLRVQSNVGQLLGADLTNINVTLPYDSEDIHITGHASGSSEAVMNLLRTTPLHQEIGSGLDAWEVKGQASADVDLIVPLNEKSTTVDVKGIIENTSLNMPDINLAFENVNGDVNYSSTRGLSSQALNGAVTTFNMPISASIVTLEKDKTLTARIRTQGKMTVDQLAAWQPSVLWSYVKGTLPYSVELQVPLNTTSSGPKPLTLVINSPLQGASIKLPTPFGKAANSIRPLTVAIDFNEKNYRIDAALKNEDVRGVLLLGKNQEPLQANVYLGATNAVSDPKSPGLWVTGNTSSVMTEEWIAFLEAEKKSAKKGVDATALGIHVDINVNELQAFDERVTNTKLTVARGDQAWKVGLDSDEVTGEIALPDNPQQPYDIYAKHIKLPVSQTTPAPTAVRTDMLATIDPKQLPAMQVKIDDFMIGDDKYGKWYFTLRPIKNGVAINNIQIDNMKYFSIMGEQASWTKDKKQAQSQTYFKGKVTTTNLDTAFKAWGYSTGVESQQARFNVDFSWPGSPAFFSMADGNGVVDFEFENGRFSDTGGKASVLKIFGALNVSALARRLTADFSDLYQSGISYDKAEATIGVQDGVATFTEPAIITGPSSDFKITGSTNLKTGEMNQVVVITPPVGQNATLIATVLCGPACGGITYLVQKVLGSGIKKLSSVKYKMTGPYENPTMTRETIFSSDTPTPTSTPSN